jgi:hypothetical protein
VLQDQQGNLLDGEFQYLAALIGGNLRLSQSAGRCAGQ